MKGLVATIRTEDQVLTDMLCRAAGQVEVDGQIVRREDFDAMALKDGGKVEFLYFMGGGGGIN